MPGVRSATLRRAKYEAKIDADVIRSRFAAQKTGMVTQVDERFAELVTHENAIKAILEADGIPTIQIPFYLNYARELYRIVTRFTSATRTSEAALAKSKWVSRGLLDSELVKIRDYFGIGAPAY